MSGTYLYCQSPDCGEYLGSLGGDSCPVCGWSACPECQNGLYAADDKHKAMTNPAPVRDIHLPDGTVRHNVGSDNLSDEDRASMALADEQVAALNAGGPPSPARSFDEAQERAAFEVWAREEWKGRSIPDNAWLGWKARAGTPGLPVDAATARTLREIRNYLKAADLGGIVSDWFAALDAASGVKPLEGTSNAK